jgi:hypothetical protein
MAWGDLPDALPVDGHLPERSFQQPVEHGRHAARGIKVLHVIRTAGLDAGEMRHSPGYLVEGAQVDVDVEIGSDGRQMQGGVCWNRLMAMSRCDGVGERPLLDHLAGAQAFLDQFHDPPSGRPGQFLLP